MRDHRDRERELLPLLFGYVKILFSVSEGPFANFTLSICSYTVLGLSVLHAMKMLIFMRTSIWLKWI
jgi:hypothetical protein